MNKKILHLLSFISTCVGIPPEVVLSFNNLLEDTNKDQEHKEQIAQIESAYQQVITLLQKVIDNYEQNTQQFNEIIKREQANTARITLLALKIVEQSNTSSDQEFNKDWFHKYFSYAQYISRPEVQELWARILAKEIIEPDSFSLRTLNQLSLLNYKEANTFAEFCKDTVLLADTNEPAYISFDSDINNSTLSDYTQFSVDKLNILTECNVIKLPTPCPISFEITEKSQVVLCTKTHILKASSSSPQNVILKMYIANKTGKELYTLCQDEPNLEVMLKIGQKFQQHFPNIKFSVYLRKESSVKQFDHEEQDLLITN